MDDDNSRNLDFYEFKKSLTDYKLGFTSHELKILFDAFDVNDDQTVDYDEFLRIVRGKMNQRRLKVVHQTTPRRHSRQKDRRRSPYGIPGDIRVPS